MIDYLLYMLLLGVISILVRVLNLEGLKCLLLKVVRFQLY